MPVFDHEVSSRIVQKSKKSGKIDKDLVLIEKDGLPALVSRDSENLFDMVERQEAGDNDG